ncbi:PCI domain-containing protein, putative [Plasmodium ovale wallikeri]|nr:PCI domain-containing protein, putative [Plasmodium ovale wallikeri]SBT75733.1 PCI domain-containing protein, putative [Plasmodium ovale]
MNLGEEHPITRKVNWLRERSKEQSEGWGNVFENYDILLDTVEECVKERNGYKLSKALKLTQIPVDINIIDELNESEVRNKIRKKNCLKNYEQLIIDHFNIIKIVCNKYSINWDILLSTSCKFLTTYIQLYCTNLWLLPYLLCICSFLNSISTLGDNNNNIINSNKNDIFNEENEDINNKNKYTIEVLNSIRGKIGIVKGDVEKHGAFIILMLQSIKLCIRLNNMQITSSFLKIINSTEINYIYIPVFFIVLFKYQLGKLYLHKEEYEKAEKEFIWAFTNSKKNKIDLRKKILECIICIRLNKGIYPSKKLLLKYNLYIYINIICSIKYGNIFLYNNIIKNFYKYFFKNDLYECIDKIHFIVKRNLLKIIIKWWNNNIINNTPNKIYKVPISLFHHIFIWAGITQHHYYLETLSIITSLILYRYINAYISYDNNILVLSKNDPFPSLSQSHVSR